MDVRRAVWEHSRQVGDAGGEKTVMAYAGGQRRRKARFWRMGVGSLWMAVVAGSIELSIALLGDPGYLVRWAIRGSGPSGVNWLADFLVSDAFGGLLGIAHLAIALAAVVSRQVEPEGGFEQRERRWLRFVITPAQRRWLGAGWAVGLALSTLATTAVGFADCPHGVKAGNGIAGVAWSPVRGPCRNGRHPPREVWHVGGNWYVYLTF